jgi:predicted permease
MRKLRAWLLRLWAQFGRDLPEKEFAEEIETHLQMQIEDNLRSGMDPKQARREALVKSGGMEVTMQAYRDGNSLSLVETLSQDLRYTIRQLRKNPGFAVTAILVLTLGIGATVSIFSFADAALIKPLPYREPSRLVVIFGTIPLGSRFHLSFPDYYDLKKLNKVFTSFEVYDSNGFMLSTPDGGQLAPGGRVSAGFFRTLGVTPILGRDFLPGEDKPSASRTVILSYAAWQSRYGKRADVLGQTVTLDGHLNTIIGVLPPEFHFAPAAPADFWAAEHDESSCRACHWLFGLARLKDGVSIQTAQAEMTTIARQLATQYPDSNRDQGEAVVGLPEVIVGDIRPIILVLLGGAALLLLIAIVNVASLLLVRTESRKREIAVRGALGASRRRLFRQFVTEGMVLAASASAIGLAAADGAMHLLTRLIPTDTLAGMPYLQGLGLTPRVLAFTLAISLCSAVVFSLTPIVSMSREEMRAGLTEGGRAASGTVWHKFGANLVVIELAMAVVLLVGAGLLGKSFYRLLQVDPGLEPTNLATIQLSTPRANYSKDPQIIALEQQILERVSALPGVTSAALTNKLPVGDGDFTTSFQIVGRPNHGEDNEVAYRLVSTDYFHTLKTRLLEGGYFNANEDATKPHVILINRALAAAIFSRRTRGRNVPQLRWGSAGVGDAGGRRYRRPPGGPAGYASPCRDLRSFRPTSDQLLLRGRPDVRRCTIAAADAHRDDSSDRSGHRGLRGFDDARANSRFAACLPAPRFRLAGRKLCRFSASAERRRIVRGDRVFGEPANTGNRSKNGAGRTARHGLPARPAAGFRTDRRGNCYRPGRIVRCVCADA